MVVQQLLCPLEFARDAFDLRARIMLATCGTRLRVAQGLARSIHLLQPAPLVGGGALLRGADALVELLAFGRVLRARYLLLGGLDAYPLFERGVCHGTLLQLRLQGIASLSQFVDLGPGEEKGIVLCRRTRFELARTVREIFSRRAQCFAFAGESIALLGQRSGDFAAGGGERGFPEMGGSLGDRVGDRRRRGEGSGVADARP